ncbi:MAG: ATP synthase F1 subunit delta [Chitinophagaceae bacterium]|nr:MAG: ATP synthase F1 subunit delta [Chitinophagaceae bacterium]
MNNPRLAGRYAKSLLGLAIEQNSLDAVYADILMLKNISKTNPDFVNLLKSPVVGADKKEQIVEAVLAGKVSTLTSSFLRLIIRKTRESNLVEIVNAFLEQYNDLKEIHTVKLSTATELSQHMKDAIVAKLKADAGVQNIELETIVEESLIGGFKLEMGGNLVDATILRDLEDVKKQFAENIYIHNIR